MDDSRGDWRLFEPLGELVNAFVAAVFELASAQLDMLAKIVASGNDVASIE